MNLLTSELFSIWDKESEHLYRALILIGNSLPKLEHSCLTVSKQTSTILELTQNQVTRCPKYQVRAGRACLAGRPSDFGRHQAKPSLCCPLTRTSLIVLHAHAMCARFQTCVLQEFLAHKQLSGEGFNENAGTNLDHRCNFPFSCQQTSSSSLNLESQ